MKRLIDPKAIKGGYKTLGRAFSGNKDLSRFKNVSKLKALAKVLGEAGYKDKGTFGNMKKTIGDIRKGRIKGLNTNDAKALANLTGGQYTIVPESIKPPRADQLPSQPATKPAPRRNPIIDRVMGNIADRRSASVPAANNPPARPNIQSSMRSQRGIGSAGVSAPPGGTTGK